MKLIESWQESANTAGSPFPLNNLPFGVFSDATNTRPRCGVAIGAKVLDLAAAANAGLFDGIVPDGIFARATLNGFMALGPSTWSEVRAILQEGLSVNAPASRRDRLRDCLVDLDKVTMHLPIEVAGYTDFYAGYHHAKNVGTMFRGADNALPPNWLHIPIGYNGRASTVVVSGTPIHRPLGQLKPADSAPVFGPSARLDIELEMGAIVGIPSTLGEPIGPQAADDMIFGYVLLNDWSARDIQVWEYQPLGPFQSKAFATTISPWVVTREALAPFAKPLPKPIEPLLPYLRGYGTLYDIDLRVLMRPSGSDTLTEIARTNHDQLYFCAAQQLVHHAIGGCAMRTGDLLGSGTISGPTRPESGSLLERTWNGQEPLQLPGGLTRSFLEDGDSITLCGTAIDGDVAIGFGACEGTILPAPDVSLFEPRNR